MATFVLLPITLSYDLSDFPKSFIENEKFNAVGTIGAKSASSDVITITDLFTTLAKNHNIRPYKSLGCPEGTVCINLPRANYDLILDEDLIDLSQNIISVGGPCANNITAQIMDLPTTWHECAFGFQEGIGRIKLYNKWNKTQIIIAGYTAEDTKKATKVLENYNNFNLSGYEERISGNVNNLSIRRILTRKDMRYCKKTEDCVNARAEPCGCSGGGKSISIHKEFYDKYIKGYEGGACVTVASDHISCFANTICVNNQCDFDYRNYSVCEGIYAYYNQCYTQFAIVNNNISICEKIIISHDGSPIKLRINECKNAVQK